MAIPSSPWPSRSLRKQVAWSPQRREWRGFFSIHSAMNQVLKLKDRRLTGTKSLWNKWVHWLMSKTSHELHEWLKEQLIVGMSDWWASDLKCDSKWSLNVIACWLGLSHCGIFEWASDWQVMEQMVQWVDPMANGLCHQERSAIWIYMA